MRGAFDVITFDERGGITGRQTVGAGTSLLGFELPRATWHTLIAREDGSTFLEIKEGPYDPATAAEFAPWAPAEGDPTSAAFLQQLRSAHDGAKGSPRRRPAT